MQGWVGGSSPADAHLVTAPVAELDTLLADLLDFTNRTDVDAVVQAALPHAQFEVIHPLADGNGRIGRVLILWLLTRRLQLLTPPSVSVLLAADVGGYASGLVRFRMSDHNGWVAWFADAIAGAGPSRSADQAIVVRRQGGGAGNDCLISAGRGSAGRGGALDAGRTARRHVGTSARRRVGTPGGTSAR